MRNIISHRFVAQQKVILNRSQSIEQHYCVIIQDYGVGDPVILESNQSANDLPYICNYQQSTPACLGAFPDVSLAFTAMLSLSVSTTGRAKGGPEYQPLPVWAIEGSPSSAAMQSIRCRGPT